ncbi:MAG: glycoside hydrolase family 95 protein [Ruminococcaceae bacterium]|nr:glycoside hydrolase family 95 protein [Oscillospiraceae bacterium]
MNLFYKAPAKTWEEGLPLGNGRLGAVVYGDPLHETIQLNEETLWSGHYDPFADNPECPPMLDEIRKAIFDGDLVKSERLANTYSVCRGKGGTTSGDEGPYGSYQTAGELHIDFAYEGSTITDYSRTLDLTTGLASIRYSVNGTPVKGSVFTSYAAGVAVCYYESEKPFTAICRFSRERATAAADPAMRLLSLTGTFPENPEEGVGMAYAAAAKLYPEGGEIEADGAALIARNVKALAVVIDIETTYEPPKPDTGVELCRNPAVPYAACLDRLEKNPVRSSADMEKMFSASAGILEELMGRVQLDLAGNDPAMQCVPTDERILRMKEGTADTGLLITYFDFGRYLLISSSYNCRLPANLQGIWADTYKTPWSGDYHVDINLQMNYWLSETCGLGELNKPYFEYIRFLSEHGSRTARIQYGADGWCCHAITTPWGFTSPGEHASWGAVMTGGAWCCTHIWERYAFSGDKAVLEEYIDVMKGAAKFFLDFLVEDPRTGYLVTCPSNSPESHFYDPVTGNDCANCAGPTMDNEIIRDVFTQTADALEILGMGEDELCAALREACGKLPPIRIGKYGQIMEWMEEYAEIDTCHRHLSPLYALFPAAQITEQTPDLMEAAAVTLDRRLGEGGECGRCPWSNAWLVNLFARLKEGDKCLKHLNTMLTRFTMANMFNNPSLFQIEGNFGSVNGIAEMLLSSHDGRIVLLPALPSEPAWSSGQVNGLCARGGFRVDMVWENSQVVRFTLHSANGGDVTVRANGKDCIYRTEAGRDLVCELHA